MKRGTADLPLHYGTVPPWLAERMSRLGGAIAEAIIIEYGRPALLQRLSDPFWFQSLGCVLGMDWHSSGITTSVMNALRKAINCRSEELGVYICGGRGKFSRETPNQLLEVANKTGLNGNELVRHSKLAAKVDNTAVQDGFQLYLHTFIVTKEGDWSVIQQGMNPNERMARRYHWLSSSLRSFMEEPHTSVCGRNQGLILNLTDKLAAPTKEGIVKLTKESPDKLMREVSIILPNHHEVKAEDVNLKRLGAALILAHETNVSDMESLLLQEGVGPRTLQSLTLVSEVIHGTPSRFSDPARFSFAHGGKDGHPFPVPTSVYDETIEVFDKAIRQARLGEKDKSNALKNLSKISQEMEKSYTPSNYFDDWVQHERDTSYKYGGKTVFGNAKKPQKKEDKDKGKGGIQLSLWD
ncbi:MULTISPECIES: DUF763 domain-containing protein [Parabacteroides]|uniref:DUF763 domain-containing protein n=5 Tax=Parabacteroides goldsteinii TaxID=328812 RepID=A0A6G1ZCL6_9BACT|nr:MULTISPECIES: DUF763 domain-containing protein [Parabacteroides]EOS17890.1 hypothetical protein C803_02096 [Parabacteroides goldsteinii dnLKV18]KAI4360267.1 hypothetical protein C825_002319 [Parabacteroides sp. ASF519]MBF0762920.1 DUF763 domain-containing protein [Parabacteroides goldsteinii]MDZ3928868.1 DUF763 domain-containing protein [Parabacteroides goldsteinii]MRX95480.1 DUF763 domain-containing protein [Parabacteroides goldsteinii]